MSRAAPAPKINRASRDVKTDKSLLSRYRDETDSPAGYQSVRAAEKMDRATRDATEIIFIAACVYVFYIYVCVVAVI